jgi:putative restriction endonuclease
MRGLVSNTDQAWFEHLAALARPHGGRLDEVNFWRPRDQDALRAIPPGAPFFLRLKRPLHAIAGWGFFAHWQLLPFREAWALFGPKNGAPGFEAFREGIARLRGADPAAPGARPLGCIVLREATFLPPERWLPWGTAEGWKRNIVSDCGYDLGTAPGSRLLELLRGGASPPELTGCFTPLDVDARRVREQVRAERDGQSTFRLRLLDAYDHRCALTGERVEPVLEAAHIQPYLGPASNHVQNGLLLKADVHKLFDAGYVTVTPDYRFRVSERVRAEYENGREYYALQDREIRRPGDTAAWPSRDALAWHGERVFLAG